MWKPISEWPTLTELFFGKGVDPAKYKGENKTPAYLSGKGKKLNKSKENGMTAEKPKAKWTSKRGTGIEDIEEVKIVASIIKPKRFYTIAFHSSS